MPVLPLRVLMWIFVFVEYTRTQNFTTTPRTAESGNHSNEYSSRDQYSNGTSPTSSRESSQIPTGASTTQTEARSTVRETNPTSTENILVPQTQNEFIEYYNTYNASRKPTIWKDEAWLTINSTVKFKILVYSQSEECWKCPLMKIAEIPEEDTTSIVVETIFGTRIKLAKELPSRHIEDICSFSTNFKESGDYWLFMNYTSYKYGTCGIILSNDPMPAEMPILFLFLGLVVVAVVWIVLTLILRRWRKGSCECLGHSAIITSSVQAGESVQSFNLDRVEKENGTVSHDPENGSALSVESKPEQAPQEEPKKKKQRLRSLDTFRGLCLTVMIFVNYGGGGYWFFEHPPWNGLTVADLVFPWFIFIMGTSMNFSFRGLLKRQTPKLKILLKIIKRALLLFGIGIVLNTNWGPVNLNEIRIPGILQRFSITYLILALMELVFFRKDDSHQDKKWAPFRDVILSIPEWLISLGILALYLGITYGLEVPGCPTGYTGPGGLSIDEELENCTGGAARYVDVMVFGEDHIYQYPTPGHIFKTKVAFDPEGLLGVLTSVFLCFLGLQAGRIIMTYDSHVGRIVRWLIWGAITGVIAAVLCKGSQNDGWIPINKNLWSVSFILTTGSFAFILLAFLYIIIDVFNIWSGSPFIYPGMNSIVVYTCHDVFYRFFPVNWYVEPIHWKLLLQDTWDTVIWVTLGYIMYRKEVFIAL